MGQAIALEVISNYILDLGSALARPESGLVGIDVGTFLKREKTGVNITSNVDELFDKSDVIIDFSSPELTMLCARIAAEKHKIFIKQKVGILKMLSRKIEKMVKKEMRKKLVLLR